MSYVDVRERFGDQVEALFSDPRFADVPFVERGFACPAYIEKNALMVMGINPSYTDGDPPLNLFYGEPGSHPEPDIDYFRRIHELAADADYHWTHLDCLHLRETSQKKIANMIRDGLHLEFIYKNMMISRDILEASEPAVILVANTLARLFMGFDRTDDGNHNVWMGFKFEFDRELGTHVIQNTDSKLCGTPVFFSSMLSGAGALDRGSRERLAWHISKMKEWKDL